MWIGIDVYFEYGSRVYQKLYTPETDALWAYPLIQGYINYNIWLYNTTSVWKKKCNFASMLGFSAILISSWPFSSISLCNIGFPVLSVASFSIIATDICLQMKQSTVSKVVNDFHVNHFFPNIISQGRKTTEVMNIFVEDRIWIHPKSICPTWVFQVNLLLSANTMTKYTRLPQRVGLLVGSTIIKVAQCFWIKYLVDSAYTFTMLTQDLLFNSAIFNSFVSALATCVTPHLSCHELVWIGSDDQLGVFWVLASSARR